MTHQFDAFLDGQRSKTVGSLSLHLSTPTLTAPIVSFWIRADYNQTMAFRLGYLVNGVPGMTVYAFDSESDMHQWSSDVHEIKAVIGDVNRAINGERDGALDDYQEWLELVSRFRRRYGVEKTPLDIRAAVNDVENGCGLPTTSWV